MLKDYLRVNLVGHFVEIRDHYFRRDDPMDYLLMWVLTGGGFVRCEGQRMTAKPGDLVCLQPHRPQEYGAFAADPWEILWIHFDGHLAPYFTDLIRAHGG